MDALVAVLFKRSVTVPKPLLSLSYRLSSLGTWSGVAGRQRLIQRSRSGGVRHWCKHRARQHPDASGFLWAHRVTRKVISVIPKDVKDVGESRRRGLLLEPLQKLKTRDPIFINGDNFTIENGRAQL